MHRFQHHGQGTLPAAGLSTQHCHLGLQKLLNFRISDVILGFPNYTISIVPLWPLMRRSSRSFDLN